MTILQTIAVAFSMFSALPMPQVLWTKKNMRYALCAFPLIGVVIGIGCVGWIALCRVLKLPVLLRGAGLCLLPVWISGGIHLDGFADTCDALASHATPEKRQEILGDPHLGAFAPIRLCCYFVASVALWCSVPRFDAATLSALLLGFCLSRALSGFAVATFPLAKNTGLAHAFSDAASSANSARWLCILSVALYAGMSVCGAAGAAMALAEIGVFFYY
ncbi:MAG: adenosylcobinamide-GDP ribazoletransferase, partial [Pygmaiobacter sp.]